MIPDLPSPAPPAETPVPLPLVFSGSGGEYFRIWIVNLALTFVTFGIYSPWAKVRRLQYFHRNTLLDGSGFDYHGKPLSILKGRLIAIGLLAAYKFALTVSVMLTLILVVLIASVLPWLLVRSLAFRLRYTSWRGLRFRFAGDTAGGYQVFLLWPMAAVLTLGLLAPVAYRALKAYQHGNACFGTARFAFHATLRDVCLLWLRTAVVAVGVPVLLVVAAIVFGGLPATIDGYPQGFRSPAAILLLFLAAFTLYITISMSMPYFLARSQNLVWNGTTLETHRFDCRLRFDRVLWISISNFFLTILTLGLFRPFAVVRMARYRAASMTFVPGEPLDQFVGAQSRDVAALGEEIADFLDIDIAL